MSDVLDNKTDSQIEEIYSLAPLEDLQNMLIQEKSLNRRRLLRKVMRTKSIKSSDNSKSEEITQNNNNNNTNIDNLKHSDHIDGNNVIQRKLDELKNELNNITDLTRRRELRKEIQQLEEKRCTCISQTITEEPTLIIKDVDKKEVSFAIPKREESVKSETRTNVENALDKKKFNVKMPVDQQSSLKTIKSYGDLLINQTQPSNSKDGLPPQKQFTNTEEKVNKNEDKILIPKNFINSNTPHDSRNRQISESAVSSTDKVKISRVSSMREMFEKPRLSSSARTFQKEEPRESITQNNVEKPFEKIKFNVKLPNNNPSSLTSFQPEGNLFKTQIQSSNDLNKVPSQIDIPKPVIMTDKNEQKLSLTKQINNPNNHSSSKTETKEPLPLVSSKINVSRVGSVKENFDQPKSQNSNTQRKVKLLSDSEINDLVNSIMKMDEPKPSVSPANTGSSNTLNAPEQRQRKTSQTSIIKMIPQMKKMAKTARSTIQAMKEQIIAFCQGNTQEYENVQIVNYSKSWADGLAFCALIHHFYPNSFDYNSLSAQNPLFNFSLAFETAKKYANIEPLIDPEDMIILSAPDEKCVYTYVQFMYNALKQHPRNMLKRPGN